MIKKIKVSINLVLGILIGFFLALIVHLEGYSILVAIQGSNIESGVSFTNELIVKILAFTIFCATVMIFNSKKIMKINLNKIGIYLILSVIASLVTAIEVTMFMMMKLAQIFPSFIEYFMNNYFIATNILMLFISLGIAIFVGVFIAFVNRKVKYIKFLTREVRIIKEGGFGKTIEVKGEDELAELCKSINNMSLELREKIDNEKKIEKNKNELITNVSHDLRTPLTSILGYVDLLKKNGFEDKEKFAEYIGIIDERSKSLNNLINELFEYTKLNNHDIKLNYSPVELGSLVEQIVGEYILLFNKEGLNLESDIQEQDIFINIDIQMIVRALENLLTNAKKYSVRNSTVVVKLFTKENKGIISVKNKVENISQDHLENLFERFYTVDKSRKTGNSTGLGLSIVKRIVELHRGNVKVSLDNDIIIFKVVLPLE